MQLHFTHHCEIAFISLYKSQDKQIGNKRQKTFRIYRNDQHINHPDSFTTKRHLGLVTFVQLDIKNLVIFI